MASPRIPALRLATQAIAVALGTAAVGWLAVAMISMVPATVTKATDKSSRAICDQIAALGAAGIRDVLLHKRNEDRIVEETSLEVDIDGDGKLESIDARYEPTSMRPRLWFVTDLKGNSYFKDDERSPYLPDEAGLIEPRGYDMAWIKLNGQVFAIDMDDERYRIAGDVLRFRNGRAEKLCTLDASSSINWSPADRAAESVCRAANAGQAEKLPFALAPIDWERGPHPRVGDFESKMGLAKVDLDGDGTPDSIVRWPYEDSGGRTCSLNWLDFQAGDQSSALRKALLDVQGFQKDPLSDDWMYGTQMLPRDEFGWSRCGDTNEVVRIAGRWLVMANDRLTSLEGRVAKPVCVGRRIYRWRVVKYLK